MPAKFTRLFFALIFLMVLTLGLLFNKNSPSDTQKYYADRSRFAAGLIVTDLCLTTESRHTRHYSTVEIMSVFQDVPGFYDHFPSSSFFPVPDSLITGLKGKSEIIINPKY